MSLLRSARGFSLAPILAALAACGAGGGASDKSEPKPQRFLNAASTDSALPQAAEIVVQDKGPTFYWLPQEKNQLQIREKLSRDGDWATMLVVVREDATHADGSHTVDSTTATWIMDAGAGGA